MTFEAAVPLITAAAQLLAQLVKQIIDSQHMTQEQKDLALQAVAVRFEAMSEKVKNVKFDAFQAK